MVDLNSSFASRHAHVHPELLEKFTQPVLQLRWGKAQIKILIVSDGSHYGTGSFDFALGLALQDGFNPAHSEYPDFANFDFTLAHRYSAVTGVTPGFAPFEFSAGSLDDFDELWLFGFSSAAPYLEDWEVDTIEAFMDAGGGVLAMGDHEDLGLGLCGGIKRVRSMRKWWYTSPTPPTNMEQAPDSTDLTRNDTVQPLVPGGNVNAGSQSDAVPQPIYPNYRFRWQYWFWRPYNWVKYPHPVLCGPRGVIKVMPDHAHEGDCILPHSDFAGEYPGSVGVEIAARGRNVVGRTKGGYTISDPREFGLIGAWDGHHSSANKGRVLVDATWHHWFNMNLTGLRHPSGDEANFTDEYKDILAYFRNCAIWLAPKDKQADMRKAGTLVALFKPHIVEHIVGLKKIDPSKFRLFGTYARDALGKTAPQCQSAAWLFAIVEKHLSKDLVRRLEAIEKKGPDRLDPLEREFEAIIIDEVATTILGGAVQRIALEIEPESFDRLEKIGKKLDKLAAEGAKEAAEYAERNLARLGKEFCARFK